jgi:putative transposase
MMCRLLEVSRAAYYAWRKKSREPDRDQPRMKLVEEAYLVSRRTYGYRRIHLWLKQNKGICINHKAVLRLMNKMGIYSIARRRYPYHSNRGQPNHHRYPHILKQQFQANRPNQKWCSDITYVRLLSGWGYLCVIKDLFDGFVVAHHFSKRCDVALVTTTLKKALQKEMVTAGTLLHSDQGLQYASHEYFVLTKAYKLLPSMSRKGNCWDNAPVESFFSYFKEEALRQQPRLSFEEVKRLIDDYVYFYNHERIQLRTKQTPFQLRSLFV